MGWTWTHRFIQHLPKADRLVSGRTLYSQLAVHVCLRVHAHTCTRVQVCNRDPSQLWGRSQEETTGLAQAMSFFVCLFVWNTFSYILGWPQTHCEGWLWSSAPSVCWYYTWIAFHFQILKKNYFYVYRCFACMCLHHVCIAQESQKRASDSPGTGDGCSLRCGNTHRPLEQQCSSLLSHCSMP